MSSVSDDRAYLLLLGLLVHTPVVVIQGVFELRLAGDGGLEEYVVVSVDIGFPALGDAGLDALPRDVHVLGVFAGVHAEGEGVVLEVALGGGELGGVDFLGYLELSIHYIEILIVFIAS